MKHYQGDTVWLRGTFYDRLDAPYDVTGITCTIYDWQGKQLGDAITGDNITHVDTGCYETPYTLPMGHKLLYYEFSGKDAAGLTQLCRYPIEPIFA
jgi:hypothetical protein